MTMDEIRAAGVLVGLHDLAVEWRESFEIEARPAIVLGDIKARDVDGDSAWDGEIVLPRAVAIEMMRWLERRALADLEKAGVTP